MCTAGADGDVEADAWRLGGILSSCPLRAQAHERVRVCGRSVRYWKAQRLRWGSRDEQPHPASGVDVRRMLLVAASVLAALSETSGVMQGDAMPLRRHSDCARERVGLDWGAGFCIKMPPAALKGFVFLLAGQHSLTYYP